MGAHIRDFGGSITKFHDAGARFSPCRQARAAVLIPAHPGRPTMPLSLPATGRGWAHSPSMWQRPAPGRRADGRDPGGPGSTVHAVRQRWRAALTAHRAKCERDVRATGRAGSQRAARDANRRTRVPQGNPGTPRGVPGSPTGFPGRPTGPSGPSWSAAPGCPAAPAYPSHSGRSPGRHGACRKHLTRLLSPAPTRALEDRMQSRWNDADAARRWSPTPRRASARTWRCAPTRRGCWARDPLLVLHGGGNTSVKTRDDGPAGRDARGAVRQGLGLGHGHHRAGRPAGGEARRRCASCARSRRSPTRTWSTSSA